MSLNDEIVRNFWNNQAGDTGYESEFGAGMLIKDRHIAMHRKSIEERLFAKLITLHEGMEVLDIGCGTGRWSFLMAPNVARVLATDISDEMIRTGGRLRQLESASNVEFLVREALDISDLGQFDLIFIGGVLQYLSDDEVRTLTKRVVRALKPRGACLTRDSVTSRRHAMCGDYPVVYRTRVQHNELCRAGGLELVTSERAYVMPALIPKIMRIAPLRGRFLDWAIRLDGLVMRNWPATWLLQIYAALTNRGCGEVPDHRFFLYRPADDDEAGRP